MSYEFTETLELFIPNLGDQLASFHESADFKHNHGLVIEISAIHEGATSNFNFYSAQELEKSLTSWTSPYPKPIIMNHDPESEPIGRIIGAKMDQEEDGTPFVRLQAAILDPEAIRKVTDGRYLTGSVGGKAKEAVCSICDTDWAAPREGARGLPCKHQRGKVYSGKIAMMKVGGIGFKEYSFVNMPADSNSVVRTKTESEEESDGWVKSARFFVLDMVEESIIEYTESEERNVLEGLRKKDSQPLYLGLKGAFLSAVVIDEEEKEEQIGVNTHKDNTNDFDSSNSEEKNMADDVTATQEEQEDILAVVEDLQKDEPTAQEEEAEVETPAESEEDTSAEEATSDKDAIENEESEGQAGERPQGQEKAHARDVDPETSEGAPKSRESEDGEGEASEQEETPTDATEDEAQNESGEENQESELDKTQEEEVEPREDEDLKARVAQLEDENKRLKKALHRTLAERVVDTKIAVGILSEEERATAIDEHVARTASSLADSLRDMAGMERVSKSSATAPNESDGPRINERSEVVGEEENVTTISDEELAQEADTPEKRLEDLLVAALGGKVKL